jgi:hypothetical protein
MIGCGRQQPKGAELHRLLPGSTGGEGVFESDFAGYRPVTGKPPMRQASR